MKKIFLSFIVLAFVFVGCEKEEVLTSKKDVSINNTTNTAKGDTLEVDFSEIILLLDGEVITDTNDLNEYGDNLISVFAAEESDTLFFFSNESDFEDWAIDQSFGVELIDMNNCISFLEDYINENNVDEYYEENNEFPEDYLLIIDSLYGVYHNSKAPALTNLFDYINYNGTRFNIYSTHYPTFGKFNGKAESLKAYGGKGSYCHKKWYRGQRFFVFAYTNLMVKNLGSHRNKFHSNFMF
jgi:hypothetical protein